MDENAWKLLIKIAESYKIKRLMLIRSLYFLIILSIINQNIDQMSDYYNAPQPANLMLSQLGIDLNNHNSTFDPKNQPLQIGKQYNKQNRNINKYAEENEGQYDKEQDYEIPNALPAFSKVIRNAQPQNKQKRGRKKETKKNMKKNKKNEAKVQEKTKQQINIDIDVNQVRQWQYKGTNANKNSEGEDEDSFDNQYQAEKQKDNDEKQAIKRRIQQKLKKYQNPVSAGQPKNTTNSLKSKALQLKEKKQQSQKQGKLDKNIDIHNQSTHQLVTKKNQIKKQQEIIHHQQKQEESQDPWDKVNQKTLAEKQHNQQAMKNAQNMDFNKFYQNLSLPEEEEQQQSSPPQTGIFHKICSCLSPKKKLIAQTQKQLLKISKVQLTNKPEQIQLLKEIWTKLTNKKFMRYGEHWNQIGFQGRDPSTDLRSTGILSLIQWNNFLNFDQDYGQKLFNMCVQFDIPLALTHIKVTSLICFSIKRRLLQGNKWLDFQEWYNAFVYYTFQYIQQNGKNLEQIGQIVQKAIQRTKKNIQNAKKFYNNSIKSKR